MPMRLKTLVALIGLYALPGGGIPAAYAQLPSQQHSGIDSLLADARSPARGTPAAPILWTTGDDPSFREAIFLEEPGSAPRPVYRSDPDTLPLLEAQLSPDHAHIAAVAMNLHGEMNSTILYILDKQGTVLHTAEGERKGMMMFAWSPDGKRIVYAEGKFGITVPAGGAAQFYQYDIASGEKKLLFEGNPPNAVSWAAFDGRIYTAGSAFSPDGKFYQVPVHHLSGGEIIERETGRVVYDFAKEPGDDDGIQEFATLKGWGTAKNNHPAVYLGRSIYSHPDHRPEVIKIDCETGDVLERFQSPPGTEPGGRTAILDGEQILWRP